MWPSRTREQAVSLFRSSAFDIFRVSLRKRLQHNDINIHIYKSAWIESLGSLTGDKSRLIVLGLVVASLKKWQESPDVEGSGTEAVGAESKTNKMVIYVRTWTSFNKTHYFTMWSCDLKTNMGKKKKKNLVAPTLLGSYDLGLFSLGDCTAEEEIKKTFCSRW